MIALHQLEFFLGEGCTIHKCTDTRDINWDAGLLYLNLTLSHVNSGPVVLVRSTAGRLGTQRGTQNPVCVTHQCSVGYLCGTKEAAPCPSLSEFSPPKDAVP